MKTEHALRYLLLRQLKAQAGQVAPDRLRAAARSLQVVRDHDAFVVAWQLDGTRHEQRFAAGEFDFYRRGDLPAAGGIDADLGTENDTRARAFAAAVFGVTPAPLRSGTAEPLAPYRGAALGEALALALTLGPGGGLGVPAGLLIAAASLGEFAPHGRLVGAALLLALAAAGPPAAGVLGGSVAGIWQYLDPDPTYRGARTLLCFGAAAVGLGRAASVSWSPMLVPLGLVAGALTVVRLLYGSHLRALPLVWPAYCLGLALDGHDRPAVLGLAVLAAGLVVIHRLRGWSPVQRERHLTPNG